ncbi:MAG: hypothetical protein AAF628_04640 [Planctomycetota bacterium]
MTEAAVLVLGRDEAAAVEVRVWSRAHPGGLGVFDDNWLFAQIAVRGGAAARARATGATETGARATGATVTAAPRFRYHAFLRTSDFGRFAERLTRLRDGATARARFWPRDPWLAVVVARDGDAADGCCEVSVRARDHGSERAVRFRYALDASGLAQLADQVDAIASRFPVRP